MRRYRPEKTRRRDLDTCRPEKCASAVCERFLTPPKFISEQPCAHEELVIIILDSKLRNILRSRHTSVNSGVSILYDLFNVDLTGTFLTQI